MHRFRLHNCVASITPVCTRTHGKVFCRCGLELCRFALPRVMGQPCRVQTLYRFQKKLLQMTSKTHIRMILNGSKEFFRLPGVGPPDACQSQCSMNTMGWVFAICGYGVFLTRCLLVPYHSGWVQVLREGNVFLWAYFLLDFHFAFSFSILPFNTKMLF